MAGIFNAFVSTDIDAGATYKAFALPVGTIDYNATTLADLTYVGPGVTLTGQTFIANVWTFANTTLPSFSYATSLQGVVIVKTNGGAESTWKPLAVLDFKNATGSFITLTSGTFAIAINFGAGGVLTSQPANIYTSGNFVPGANGNFPFGLMHLIGTSNNTVAFTNPVVVTTPTPTNKVTTTSIEFSNTTAYPTAGVCLTDRNSAPLPLNTTGNFARMFYDFGAGQIKPVNIGFRDLTSAITGFKIYGSNQLTSPTFVLPAIDSVSTDWTLLHTTNFIAAAAGVWQFAAIPAPFQNYYRYLKFEHQVAGNAFGVCQEIEFYNSSFRTPTAF